MRRGTQLSQWGMWALGGLFAVAGAGGLIWTMRAVDAGKLDTGDLAGVLSFGFSGLGLVLGAASLLVSWQAYQTDRSQRAAEFPLEAIVNELAATVRTQWEAEARVRRLNDPYPLPASWDPADASLVENWDLLHDQAARSGSPRSTARTPAALAGMDAEITEVFARRAPGQRLLVLGEPGSGKSMLLLTLLLGLLDQRAQGGSVPVVFPLASFDPARQDLLTWLRRRLEADYPGLRRPVPASHNGLSLAGLLLRERLVLPLLDGFDELPEDRRPQALHAINEALPPGSSFVLASRSDEYRAALNPSAGVPVRLTGTAGIRLLPLTASVAADYLERDAGGSESASALRWRPVIAQLRVPGSAVAQVLTTPLMIFLARTIYNPRPGETSAALPDPAELCDQERFSTPAGLRAHLLNAYIPAAYRRHPEHPCPWGAERAQKALASLAVHLKDNLDGTTDIAWWQLREAVPRLRHLSISSLIAVVATVLPPLVYLGLSGVSRWSHETWEVATVGIPRALIRVLDGIGIYGCVRGGGCSTRTDMAVGLIAMSCIVVLVSVLTSLGAHRLPARRISWSLSSRSLFRSFVAGGVVGCFVAFVDDYVTGFVWGAAVMICVLTVTTLTSAPADLTTRVDPVRLLTDDRRTAFIVVLLTCLASGLVLTPAIFMGGFFASGNFFLARFTETMALATPVGLVLGLPVGVAIALNHTAWGPYTVTRLHQLPRRDVPFDTMAFLRDAHEHRGVLRQVGAVYQFRHLELQHCLAQYARAESSRSAS